MCMLDTSDCSHVSVSALTPAPTPTLTQVRTSFASDGGRSSGLRSLLQLALACMLSDGTASIFLNTLYAPPLPSSPSPRRGSSSPRELMRARAAFTRCKSSRGEFYCTTPSIPSSLPPLSQPPPSPPPSPSLDPCFGPHQVAVIARPSLHRIQRLMLGCSAAHAEVQSQLCDVLARLATGECALPMLNDLLSMTPYEALDGAVGTNEQRRIIGAALGLGYIAAATSAAITNATTNAAINAATNAAITTTSGPPLELLHTVALRLANLVLSLVT